MSKKIKSEKLREENKLRRMAFIGMLAALAAVLMLIEIPLPFAPSFYKLDASEVPVLIGAFAFGPLAGVVIELVKIAVKLVISGTSTAFVGELANFVIGISMALPAAFIYKRNKTKRTAVVGLAAGTLCMTVVGCLVNAFVLLPAYAAAFEMPIEALIGAGTAVNPLVTDLAGFALLIVAPFNLVKGAAVSVLTFLLYKRISRLIKQEASAQ